MSRSPSGSLKVRCHDRRFIARYREGLSLRRSCQLCPPRKRRRRAGRDNPAPRPTAIVTGASGPATCSAIRSSQAEAPQDAAGRAERQLRRVVRLREVRQHQRLELRVVAQDVLEQFRRLLVREVPALPLDPLLHRPRVGAVHEHRRVVVELQHEQPAAGEVLVHQRDRVAEVGRVPGLHPLVEEHVGHRVRHASRCWVRRPPWLVCGVENGRTSRSPSSKSLPGLDVPDGRQLAEVPPLRLVRPRGEIDRDPVAPREDARAADVIGVLVGDQDPGEVADIGADRRDAPLESPSRSGRRRPGRGAAGLDEGAVAGAAAGEDVDLQEAPPAGRPGGSSRLTRRPGAAPGRAPRTARASPARSPRSRRGSSRRWIRRTSGRCSGRGRRGPR